jgi:hypothetical protein
MTSRLSHEVMHAAAAAHRRGDRLISRQRIEDEIEHHPDRYPGLTSLSRIGRRRIITKTMNAAYPPWGGTEGRQYSFVWEIETDDDETRRDGKQ